MTYEVGAEKVREFADAIAAANPVHHDHEAAKTAGFRDLVAPPMFCVVYSARAMGPAILDPAIGINLAAMLHGSQEFEWDEPVCDGDVIETVATCKEIYEKDAKGFYVFETISTNPTAMRGRRAISTQFTSTRSSPGRWACLGTSCTGSG